MTFQELINNFKTILTKKYFCFEGRAGQKEFWMWVLVVFVISVIFNIIPVVGRILSLLFSLIILCPALSVTARRLHDTGKSGWWQLLSLIPIGAIVVLILCIPEGDKGSNVYGAPAGE